MSREMNIETETQLEEILATPNEQDVDALRRLSGDVMILGAGGKMGPSLARRIKRATEGVAIVEDHVDSEPEKIFRHWIELPFFQLEQGNNNDMHSDSP